MNYTVVGLFKELTEAENAKAKLESQGFETENIDYSTYRDEGDYTAYDYQYKEDETSTGFWDWLFGTESDEHYNADERERYSRLGSRTNIVTVYADNMEEAEKARDILDEAGSLDVEEYDRSLAEYKRRYGDETVSNDEFNEKLEVIREQLKVGKKEVAAGGVRVKSRIVEKPVEADVRLRKERIYVKRNKVDRPADESNWDGFRDGTIELHATDEEAVVGKDARVVEEISLGKEVDTETEHIEDTVRETEVDVEKINKKDDTRNV